MKEAPHLYQKKVLVLGLAKSGFTAARILNKLGAFVTVNDSKPFEEKEQDPIKRGNILPSPP